MLETHTDTQIKDLAIELLGHDGQLPDSMKNLPLFALRALLQILIKDGRTPITKLPEANRRRNFEDFHRLWGAAAPSPGYNKKLWIAIESQLYLAGAI